MPLMIYCTAALTSFSDSISYITYLFSGWRIGVTCNICFWHFDGIGEKREGAFKDPLLTLHNVCVVHRGCAVQRGMFSTLGDIMVGIS